MENWDVGFCWILLGFVGFWISDLRFHEEFGGYDLRFKDLEFGVCMPWRRRSAHSTTPRGVRSVGCEKGCRVSF